MGEARDRKSKSPHATALLASFAVLLTGSAVGTYFVQLRGEGWHAMFAGSFGPELVIVCGAVAALAVVVHLSVARALGLAQSAHSPRLMIRRALEALDTFDGTGLEEVPGEVRDLVEMFAAQKSREQQVERELQAMHRSTRELVQRLEQSGAKLEALSAEPNDELATRIAQAWNPLIEQAHQSRELALATAAAPKSPGTLFAAEQAFLDAHTVEAPADLARRLGELETNLSMLWNEMRGLQTFAPEPLAAEPPATFSPPPLPVALQMSESPPMPIASPIPELQLVDAPAPAVQQMHTPAVPPALVTLPETRTFEALQEVRVAAMPEMLVEPEATAPWSAPASGMPTFEPVESVPVSPAEDIRWATSEVLQPDRSTKASVSGYFAWTGQSTQEGSWKLRDEAPEELRRGGEAPAKSDATPPAFVDDTYPQLPPRLHAAAPDMPPSQAAPGTPSVPTQAARAGPAPASPSFESQFPHFVGKPVQQLEGRVEVSFEGTPRERPEARRSEGSARPPAPEGAPVFDLRSLGALEID